MKIDIKKILPQPGIYIFKDKDGKALYVGKAKNLRNRIKYYLKTNSEKIINLLNHAENIELIYTKNEAEAIFKESNLIKKLNPPYNQLLRDDTRYFYLIFTKEKFPKSLITHQPEKYSYSYVIGPFSEGKSLRIILKELRKSIPFCTCYSPHLRKCLNAEIGLCLGYCCIKNYNATKEEINKYFKNIKMIVKIFKGDFTNLKKNILQKIKKLLKENKIEEALYFQKVYISLKKIEENKELLEEKDAFLLDHERRKILIELQKIFNLPTLPKRIETIDISHIGGEEKVGALVTFIDGNYSPSFLRKFRIKSVYTPDDPRMIYEVITRRLNHPEWGYPDLFLIDGGKIQFKFAKKAIKDKKMDIPVISFAKPKEEVYYDENKKPIPLKDHPLINNFIKLIDQKVHKIVLKYLRKRKKI